MPLIQLTNFIEAPADRIFKLSLSTALHKFSMADHGERMLACTGGKVMQLGDEVTWQAKHLWKERKLKVRITALQQPHYFCDEQVEGDFKRFKHEHYFKPVDNGTLMIDQFFYELPYGSIGSLFNRFYFEKYMEKLLQQRNSVIRKVAEGRQWQQFL